MHGEVLPASGTAHVPVRLIHGCVAQRDMEAWKSGVRRVAVSEEHSSFNVGEK